MPALLTVTIITKNEEFNLPRTLDSVQWADEILVVDSQSSDKTTELAREKGAKIHQNPFENFGKQKNFAQDQATHPWILNIDADEVVSDELREEIQEVLKRSEKKGFPWAFSFPRKNHYFHRWIRFGGWYPNYVTRLYHKDHCRWTEPAVHEHLELKNPKEITRKGKLKSPLLHYTFRGVEDQIATNLRYARLGSIELKNKGVRASVFKLIVKPIGKFLETYVVKRGMMDGIPGLIISLNAAQSIFLKYVFLLESDLKDRESSHR